MANILSSAFWADAPADSPLSYDALQARRKIAEGLLSKRSPFPKTLGEGLTYAGERFYDAAMERDLTNREAARTAALGQEATNAYRPTTTADNEPTDEETPASAPTRVAALTPSAAPGEPAAPNPMRDQIATVMTPPPQVPADQGRIPLPPPRPVYDRNRQIAELQANPALANRILTIARGEVGDNPQEQQIIAETIMNRAAARDQPLAQVTRQYTGPGSTGYYPASTFGRGAAPLDILSPVLRGSDAGGQALGFAPTGNASGGVASRGVASGRYNVAGQLPGSAETYVQQERPEQLARLAATRQNTPDFVPTTAPQRMAALTGGGASPTMTDIPSAPPDAAPAARINDAFTAIPSAPPAPRQPTPTQTASQDAYQPIVARQPTEEVRLNQPEPPRPRPTPQSQRELQALQRMAMFPGDPDVQRIWQPIAAQEAAQRAFTDKIIDQQYQARLGRLATIEAANQEAARKKGMTELEMREKELNLPRLAPSGATPVVQTRFGPVDTRLGTEASPYRNGIPDAEPLPVGANPKEWAALQTKKQNAVIEANDKANPQFTQMIDLIQQANAHPGRHSAVGFFGKAASLVPGTEAYGYAQLLDQIKNKNFLSAYDTLRGAGQISNVEGEKSAQAQARLSQAQSKEDFQKALNDFELTVRSDFDRIQRKAHVPVTAWQLGRDDKPAPDIGQLDTSFADGVARRYRGGNPRDPNSWQMLR